MMRSTKLTTKPTESTPNTAESSLQMQDLPAELLLDIFSYHDPKELLSLREVNHSYFNPLSTKLLFNQKNEIALTYQKKLLQKWAIDAKHIQINTDEILQYI